MDLRLTDEQIALVEALHDFAENEIRPVAREAEEAGEVPERIEKQLFEMGVSTPIPESAGGQGTFDAVTSVLLAEELAWGDPGIAYSVLTRGSAATLIDQAASAGGREELLARLSGGESFSVAIAEREAGAGIFDLETRSVPDDPGSGSCLLTGVKYGVARGKVSDGACLVAVSDAGGPAIVMAEPGTGWKQEDKLGLRSARTFKLTLDRVTGEVIGQAGPASTLALCRAKLIVAGVCLGLGRAALEYATTYAGERTAFGKPIGAFQAISFKIADRAMELESARLFVWKAAETVDAGHADARAVVMAACGSASAAALACADDAVQILGGHGYMRDHPVEMWYRDALTLATFDSAEMVADPYAASVISGGQS